MNMKFFFSLTVSTLLSMSAMAQSGTFGSLTWTLSNDSTLTIGGTGVIEQNSPWAVHKDKSQKACMS
jgi:type 1 fimbria pilin